MITTVNNPFFGVLPNTVSLGSAIQPRLHSCCGRAWSSQSVTAFNRFGHVDVPFAARAVAAALLEWSIAELLQRIHVVEVDGRNAVSLNDERTPHGPGMESTCRTTALSASRLLRHSLHQIPFGTGRTLLCQSRGGLADHRRMAGAGRIPVCRADSRSPSTPSTSGGPSPSWVRIAGELRVGAGRVQGVQQKLDHDR